MHGMTDRTWRPPPRWLRLLTAGVLAAVLAGTAMLTPTHVRADTYPKYSFTEDDAGYQTGGVTSVQSSRYDQRGIYGNETDCSGGWGPYAIFQDMWVSFDGPGTANNWVEFGTAHCIDYSGNDHVWWVGGEMDNGMFRWIFWPPATLGDPHFFQMYQVYNSTQWNMDVDNTWVGWISMSNRPYLSGTYAQAGLETHSPGAFVPYFTDWGLGMGIHGVGQKWKGTRYRTDLTEMYGAYSASDQWVAAQGQSSSSQNCHQISDAQSFALSGGAANANVAVGC